MLSIVGIAVGVLLVLTVFVDALVTTLAVSAGAGPITGRVLSWTWRVMLKVHRSNASRSFLNGVGPVLLTLTVVLWVASLWLGWSLVFLGSDAIVSSADRRPAGAADVVYFSGFTVVSLGTGDYVAASAAWRVISVLAGLTGLSLVTLAITYLISVVSAVVARRSLALQIDGLGSSAHELVLRGWNGTGFSSIFEQQLVTLTGHLVTSAEQHLAYPVLHYFHSGQRPLAAPIAVAKIDDAVILLDAVDPSHRPDRNAVVPLRSAIERYVATATHIALVPEAPAPPTPALDPLQEAGVPLAVDGDVAVTRDDSDQHRTELHQLVTRDGWTWSAVR